MSWEKEKWRRNSQRKGKTAGSQPCKRKRLTEVLKAPIPSPAKTGSWSLFHNRTQDRTKECKNCTVLDLGISKDREWAAKAPRVCLLNTYCTGKRPRTGWSTRLPILKILRDATLRLCQWLQLTLPPLNQLPNLANNMIKQRQVKSGCWHPNWRTVL